MIRVGTINYNGGKKVFPRYDDFIPIEVMTPSTKYGSLSPYSLKNDKGQLMENIWQFSKIYESVPITKQYYSRYDHAVIWQQKKTEVHIVGDEIKSDYWKWRKRGFKCEYAIRYPVGQQNMKKCVGTVLVDENNEYEIIDYVTARKRLYSPTYKQLVREADQYSDLLKKLKKGTNLLIMEVDGPHSESLNYYMKKYGVDDDFIENNTILATKKNLKIMVNDDYHRYGHGYCLAEALMEDMG